MKTNTGFTLLLVDDDAHVLETLNELFQDNYSCLLARSGVEAVEIAKAHSEIAAVVLDMKMAGMDGTATFREIQRLRSDLPIIIHTGHPGEYDEGEIDTMLRPFDYIRKGKSINHLERSVRNACETTQLRMSKDELIEQAEQQYGMIGRSRKMLAVYERIRKIGKHDIKVLITGETGTGKELVAKAIFQNSRRNELPFEIYNCNHKNPELVESELFGHKRGSFTGAIEDRIGIFEYANEGTVFLDEIGDLDITTQAKLLRVIELGEFQTIGAPGMRNANVRIISATNKDLAELVKKGTFREDLYYRLQEVQVALPPLRERREDIPLLIDHFTDWYCFDMGAERKKYETDAKFRMIEYNWPGNIRQLRHTVRRLVFLGDSNIITKAEVCEALAVDPSNGISSMYSDRNLATRVKEFKKVCVIEALTETEGNVSAAGRILGTDPANLRKLMIELDISR